jgi:putative ABC transport system substrate-binding protein
MATRRDLLRGVAAGGLARSLAGFAQSPGKVWQIGFLGADAQATGLYGSFRQGMQQLGYVEGRNCTLLARFAEGRYQRLPGLAEELVRSKADVIVAGTTLSVQAAKKATGSLPIVMVAIPDPVGEGFAVSLSRPGGNITGLSTIVTEASAKHVELLRSVVPGLSRLALLINPNNPSDSLILEQVSGAAFLSGVKVSSMEASTVTEIESAFAAIVGSRVEAMIVAADPFFDVQRSQIAALSIKSRLTTIFSNREFTEAGGLMSYGQDLPDQYRRAAAYVDKILRGAKPSELPVEQPLVLELVINRRTAKALGLQLPRELLLRADKIIE